MFSNIYEINSIKHLYKLSQNYVCFCQQEELKRRRLIADQLKKQQKKKQKEHLRAQEASLKSQIEVTFK